MEIFVALIEGMVSQVSLIFRLITFYTLHMYSFWYVNHTSMKVLKKKTTFFLLSILNRMLLKYPAAVCLPCPSLIPNWRTVT